MMKGNDYDYDDGDGDDEGNDNDGDGFYEVSAGGDVWTGRPCIHSLDTIFAKKTCQFYKFETGAFQDALRDFRLTSYV